MRLLALLVASPIAIAQPCAGLGYQGEAGATTPAIVAEAPAPEPVDTARLVELEQRCRATIPATTFQQAAEALSRVRAAIGRLCTIALVGDTPLQWRVSCGSDDFFASGRHEFGETTACEGGANAFECLGHGLRAMGPFLEHVDVAVVGHVDLQLPRDPSLRCDDLTEGGWATPPWSGRVRRDRSEANDRLAWCRAARAADAVARGLGGAAPPRLAAIGASSQWLRARLDPSAEEARCPPPTSDEDEPSEGRCQSARRVDVLIRLAATPSEARSRCARVGATPADVLYCLEECVSRPEATQSALANPSPFFRPTGTARTRPTGGWYVTRSAGAPPVDLEAVLTRLGL